MLLDDAELSRHFPREIRAIEESFTAERLRPETARRARPRVTIQELPPLSDAAKIFSRSGLSRSLSEVDKLIHVTAVHFKLDVVTADKTLAKSLKGKGVKVGDAAMILKELVDTKEISKRKCEAILESLADRKDFILGVPHPSWDDLKNHEFP